MENTEIKRRGSYFPNEHYCFDDDTDKLETFVSMLKNRGYYIGKDWHIRSKKGVISSKLMRNGYYMIGAQYNKKYYYFMEHRVIYCWLKGAIPEGKVVNHIDYNKANNNIDNLELLTQKENVEHSRPNFNPPRGERGKDAKFTNKQVSAIKYVLNTLGWSPKKVAEFTGEENYNFSRIKTGTRYGDVLTSESILEAYPILVDYTRNKEIGLSEELKNYAMGLAGETGEVVDILKKHFFHGKELDRQDLMLELGDVLFYLVAMMNVLGEDVDLVALNNNAKLLARYADGFSEKASNERIEDNR